MFSLNYLNFFLSDVRDGLGPFLVVFLQGKGWRVDDIGIIMTLGGLAGMALTIPIGILIDVIKSKREVIVFSAITIVSSCSFNYFFPSFSVTLTAQIFSAIAGASIAPAITAITLGLVGSNNFDKQIGKNESYNHAGNALSSILAGVFSFYFGLSAVFILMGLWAIISIFFVLSIREKDIDHNLARGLTSPKQQNASLLKVFFDKKILIISVIVTLFHLANAPLLPLLCQEMVEKKYIDDPGSYTAATVLVAQLTMIPAAIMAVRLSKTKGGYYFVFILALSCLPIRAFLAGFISHPYVLFPVQILDGIGAGLIGIAVPGLVARILKGSGRFNSGLAFVMTIQGVGASMSHYFAGKITVAYDYSMAFFTLSCIAIAALFVWIASTKIMGPYCKPLK